MLQSLADAPNDARYALTAGDLRTLLDLALHPQPDVFKARPFFSVADILIINLICARHQPALIGVKRAISTLSSDRRGNRTLLGFWGDYQSVAHLWASALHWSGKSTFSWESELDREWIKDPAGKLRFLAMAEAFRTMGENTYAHGQKRRRNPSPLLDPSQSWRVPEDIALPSVSIDLPEPQEGLVKALKAYSPSRRPSAPGV